MPYIEQKFRDVIQASLDKVSSDGDYNYVFSVAYLEEFIGNPSYATIANIRKASIQPSKLSLVEYVEDFLTVKGVTLLDRQVARDLAFMEFYRRVAAEYEDEAILKNGDLPEFAEAGEAINQKFYGGN